MPGVGLEAVGAGAGGAPFDRRGGGYAGGVDGMDRRVAGVVVGGEEVVTAAVGGEIAGVGFEGGRTNLVEAAISRVDAVAGYGDGVPPPDIEKPLVGAEGHRGRAAGSVEGFQRRQGAGGGVHSQPGYFVRLGKGNIHIERHSCVSLS